MIVLDAEVQREETCLLAVVIITVYLGTYVYLPRNVFLEGTFVGAVDDILRYSGKFISIQRQRTTPPFRTGKVRPKFSATITIADVVTSDLSTRGYSHKICEAYLHM